MLCRLLRIALIPFILLPSSRVLGHVHDCGSDQQRLPHIHLGHHHDRDSTGDSEHGTLRQDNHDDDAVYFPVQSSDSAAKPESSPLVSFALEARATAAVVLSFESNRGLEKRPQPPPDPCPVYLRKLALLI